MRRPICAAAVLFAAVLFLCLQIVPPQYPDYRALDRRTLTAVGTVVSKDHRQSEDGASTLLITMKDVCVLNAFQKEGGKDMIISGRVLVRVPVDHPMTDAAAEEASPIGARIRVRGKVRCYQQSTNPGEFDARLYYRIRGYDLQMSNAAIHSDDLTARGSGKEKDPLRDFLYRIRCRGSDVLRRCLSAEDASVLQAMLLGEKGYLSDETKRLYQQNGIIHILAISGLHISVIGMGFYRLLHCVLGWLWGLVKEYPCSFSPPSCAFSFSPFSRSADGSCSRRLPHNTCSAAPHGSAQHLDPRAEYLRTERFLCLQQWISGTAAILLMILYGLMTSAGASAVRAIIMFILHIRAIRIRRTYDLLTAVSAAAVLILIQEPLYLYDSGFLFSFSAVIAIGALLPSLKGKVLKTLAVPLGTLPVSIHFNSFFPVWSVLINLLVLPMMGLLLPIGFLVLLLGLLSVKLGILAGTAAHVILLCYYALCRMAQRLPGSVLVTGSCSTLQILLYLLCLAGAAYIESFSAKAHRDLSSFNLIRSVELLLCFGNGFMIRKSSRRSAGQLDKLQQNKIYIAIMEVLCELNSNVHTQFHKLFSRFYTQTCKVQKKRSFTPLWQFLLIASGIAILLYHPARGLSIHVIDVGQGDGILIQYEETAFKKSQIIEKLQRENTVLGVDILNRQQNGSSVVTSKFRKRSKTAIMIDGGSTDRQNLAQYQLEPFLRFKGCSVIDCWIITHDDSDHCSGLLQILEDPETFRTVQIQKILLPPAADRAQMDMYQRIRSLATARAIPVGVIQKGDVLSVGDLSITCLHPSAGSTYDAPNEESVTLYLRYGEFDALFTGDLEGRGEADLLRSLDVHTAMSSGQPVALDLLKVAHHGSSGATSEAFLSYFQPKKAVISCGRNNRYGHPHRETMERLSEAGADVLQTKVCGEITYQTDGKYLTVRPFLSN
jgi:competence protein ComEC